MKFQPWLIRGWLGLPLIHMIVQLVIILLYRSVSFAADPTSYLDVWYDGALGQIRYDIKSDEPKSFLLNFYCNELNGSGRSKILNNYRGWETQLIPYVFYANSGCSNSGEVKVLDQGSLKCPYTIATKCEFKRNSDSAQKTMLPSGKKCEKTDPSWLEGEQACSCGENKVSTPINQECPAPVLAEGEVCNSTKSSWYSLMASCYCGEKAESHPQEYIRFVNYGASCASVAGLTLPPGEVCKKEGDSWDKSFGGCRCPAGMVRATPEHQKCPPPELPPEAACDETQPSFYSETRVCNCGYGEPDALYGGTCTETKSAKIKLPTGRKCNEGEPSWDETKRLCWCDENFSGTPSGQECPAPALPKDAVCDEKQPSWYSDLKSCGCPVGYVSLVAKGEKCDDSKSICKTVSVNYVKEKRACDCGSGVPMVAVGAACGDGGKKVLGVGQTCNKKDPSWIDADVVNLNLYDVGACACGVNADEKPVGEGETCPKKALKAGAVCGSSDPSYYTRAKRCNCGNKMPDADEGSKCGEAGSSYLKEGVVCTDRDPSWSASLKLCACKDKGESSSGFMGTTLNSTCPAPILKQGTLCGVEDPSYFEAYEGCYCGNKTSATASAQPYFVTVNKDCPTSVAIEKIKTNYLPSGETCGTAQPSWQNSYGGCKCGAEMYTPSGKTCPPPLLPKGVKCSAADPSWFADQKTCVCGVAEGGSGQQQAVFVIEGQVCDPANTYLSVNRYGQTALSQGQACNENDRSWDALNGWCNCGDGKPGAPPEQTCPSPILAENVQCSSADPSWYLKISKCNCGSGVAPADKGAKCTEAGKRDGGEASGVTKTLAGGMVCAETDSSYDAASGACRCGDDQPPTPLSQKCPSPSLPKGALCGPSDPSWYLKTSTCNCGVTGVVAEKGKSCAEVSSPKVLNSGATCAVSDPSYDAVTGLCHCGEGAVPTPEGQKCPGEALARDAVCTSAEVSWNKKTSTCYCGAGLSSAGNGQQCAVAGSEGGDVLASDVICDPSQRSFNASTNDCNCGAGNSRAATGGKCR